jgi:hypothetical protein
MCSVWGTLQWVSTGARVTRHGPNLSSAMHCKGLLSRITVHHLSSKCPGRCPPCHRPEPPRLSQQTVAPFPPSTLQVTVRTSVLIHWVSPFLPLYQCLISAFKHAFFVTAIEEFVIGFILFHHFLLIITFYSLVIFFLVLRLEPRVLYVPGKCSTLN